MTTWKSEINISDIHKEYKEGKLTSQQVSQAVCSKIRRHKDYGDDFELQNIADEFQSVAEDNSSTIDDYDYALNLLYNWADDNKCWVETQ